MDYIGRGLLQRRDINSECRDKADAQEFQEEFNFVPEHAYELVRLNPGLIKHLPLSVLRQAYDKFQSSLGPHNTQEFIDEVIEDIQGWNKRETIKTTYNLQSKVK